MTTRKSTRIHERTKLKIPLQVYYSENADEAWVEDTSAEQITICGAGFTLSRPVEPKRLVRLALPMPKRFRLFDYSKEKYDVWAVVRYVQVIESDVVNRIRLMIGTALVGENPPASFLNDPKTLYDLKPILKRQSFWALRELPRRTGPYMRSFEERREINIRLVIEATNEKGEITESIEAETLNISESGIAVIAKFNRDYPAYVLIRPDDETEPLLAVVRGVHKLDSNDSLRLHMEFISGKWIFS